MPGNVRPVADERDGLMAYLAHQRYLLKLAAHGLTDEQARSVPSASALSVGGLIKHTATVEREWIGIVLGRSGGNDYEAYETNFRMGPDETLTDVYAFYDRIAQDTEEVIAGTSDLGRPVPVPKGVPWFPDDVEAWSVRWVLLHIIEETARHAGHADIIRESLDGATAIPLMAAAEGWPPNPWLQPWTPTAG